MSTSIVGRYVLTERFGTSRFSERFLARSAGSSSGQENPFVLERFARDLGDEAAACLEREARAGQLLRHERVLALHDFGRNDGAFFAVYGPEATHTLADFLVQSSAPPPPMLACQVALQICDALAAAHSYLLPGTTTPSPLRHTALTPDVILISPKGEVKLAGFGLHGPQRQPSAADLALHRLPFLAPECFDSAGDARSDQFSLGVLLWELLAGVPLFSRKDPESTGNDVRKMRISAPSSRRPELPAVLDTFVLRLLERLPEARFPSAEEAKYSLQKTLFSLDARVSEKDVAAWASALLAAPESPSPPQAGTEVQVGTEHTLGGIAHARSQEPTKELTRESAGWVATLAAGEAQTPRPAEFTEEATQAPIAGEEPTLAPRMIGDLEPTLRTPKPGFELPASAREKTKLVELRGSKSAIRPTPASPSPEPRHAPVGKKGRGFPWWPLGAGLAMSALLGVVLLRALLPGSAPVPLPAEAPALEGAAEAPQRFMAPESMPNSPPTAPEGEIEFQGKVLPETVLVDGQRVALQGNRVPVPLGKSVEVTVSAQGYRDVKLRLRVRSASPLPVLLAFEKAAP